MLVEQRQKIMAPTAQFMTNVTYGVSALETGDQNQTQWSYSLGL